MSQVHDVAAAAEPGEGRSGRADACDGFTLVELLTIVTIIGVLAMIAIPLFLTQRDRARDAAVQSDLRNAAALQVAQLNEADAAADTLTELIDLGFNPSPGVEFVNADDFATGDPEFCMQARAEHGAGLVWSASSEKGVAPSDPAGC